METLSDNAPKGAYLYHDGQEYYLDPRILSGKYVRAIREKVAELNRQELNKILTMEPPLPPDDKTRIIDRFKPMTSISFQDVLVAVQVPELVGTILVLACDQIKDYKQAMQIIDDYPDFIELMGVVLEAMGMSALKNSKGLRSDGSDSGQGLENENGNGSEAPTKTEETAPLH